MENKKQEIISLLEEMDEEYLNWLLNLIKLRPIKKEKGRYSNLILSALFLLTDIKFDLEYVVWY